MKNGASPSAVQLSMMINKAPFVQEAAGSIAADYTERVLETCERWNRGSLSASLCSLTAENHVEQEEPLEVDCVILCVT